MTLNTFVKISNISNLSDARYCAGMGADQLGFGFHKEHAESITPELFEEIKQWISGITLVGEFYDMPTEEIAAMQSRLNLDVVEVSSFNLLKDIALLGKPISFRYPIFRHAHILDLPTALMYLNETSNQVIIECELPELFDEIDKVVAAFSGKIRVLKGYDLHPGNIQQLTGYQGIQLIGTPEEQPGLKDYGQVMDILEALEVE